MSSYTDLDLLFRKHPVTADVIKLTDEAAIKASVVNLITTKNYERPFHPEIGCQIYGLLFENFNPGVKTVMQQTIKDVLDKFEPRITLKDVKIRDKVDENQLEVEIYFIINSTDKLVSITTAISRIR
jgi:phage baseplate assembly protein W